MVGDICNLSLPSSSADVVIMADVLDHIEQFGLALYEAARVLRPKGALFIGTINRTLQAWWAALALGETLRLIPPGTHDYRLFITPDELAETAAHYGLIERGRQGESIDLWPTITRWAVTLKRSDSTSLAYSMRFERIGGSNYDR